MKKHTQSTKHRTEKQRLSNEQQKKMKKTNESKKKKEPNRKVKIEQYVFHQNPGLNSSSQ